jgi:hypothetical protein
MLWSFQWHRYRVFFGLLSGLQKKRKDPAPIYDFFPLAKEAIKEVRTGILRAAIKKMGKQELMTLLLCLLRHYPSLASLQAHPFRVAINNVIITETARHCSIHLNDEELLFLWHEIR